MINDKNTEIDIVVIGDYYGIRGKIAALSLESGRHIYSDKPLCVSLSELEEIERSSAERDLKVGLMLDMRYNKAVRAAYRIIKEGELGKINNIFFSAQHPLLYNTRPHWYFEDGKHGGTINDIAIHGVDIVEWFTGDTLKNIIGARCWNAYAKETPRFKDCGQFVAELSKGTGVMADVSYSAPDSSGYTLPFYWRFTVWGTKGVMEFAYNSNIITLALSGRSGTESVIVPDIVCGNCLDTFLDELEGKPTEINTESVIQASRDTLRIQQSSI